MVLETLLEVERAKAVKPKRKKPKPKAAKKAKAAKVLDIPAFLPKITDEMLLRATGTGTAAEGQRIQDGRPAAGRPAF